MNKTELRSIWRDNYYKRKADPKYIEARKKRSNRYWTRHVFMYLAKRLRHNGKSDITGADLWKLAKKQKLLCSLTGRRLTRDNVSVDHICHKVNGGLNAIDNIRLVVKEANFARHTMTDDAFVKMCQDVVNTINCLTLD